jgi:hypothetical protein
MKAIKWLEWYDISFLRDLNILVLASLNKRKKDISSLAQKDISSIFQVCLNSMEPNKIKRNGVALISISPMLVWDSYTTTCSQSFKTFASLILDQLIYQWLFLMCTKNESYKTKDFVRRINSIISFERRLLIGRYLRDIKCNILY